jgi:hypothetical protein
VLGLTGFFTAMWLMSAGCSAGGAAASACERGDARLICDFRFPPPRNRIEDGEDAELRELVEGRHDGHPDPHRPARRQHRPRR